MLAGSRPPLALIVGIVADAPIVKLTLLDEIGPGFWTLMKTVVEAVIRLAGTIAVSWVALM